jgi:hypothetical protein
MDDDDDGGGGGQFTGSVDDKMVPFNLGCSNRYGRFSLPLLLTLNFGPHCSLNNVVPFGR